MPLEGKLGEKDMEIAIGQAIWEGPAIFTNKMWIVWTGQAVRITFAEQAGPTDVPKFRSAVAMGPADAIAFSKALAATVRPLEEALQAQAQAMEK
jgi:hypothetical protein